MSCEKDSRCRRRKTKEREREKQFIKAQVKLDT